MRYWRETEKLPFEQFLTARRPAHERLGLRLHRQAAGERDRSMARSCRPRPRRLTPDLTQALKARL